MADLVLDTHVLAEVISQYYKNEIPKGGAFISKHFISEHAAHKLNQINRNYLLEEDFRFGIVVTSIFSFVEIARKFDSISDGMFTLLQFRAFLDESPPWLQIEPLSPLLLRYFYFVPKAVEVAGELKRIEWPDAVHCATYLSRQHAQMVTRDSRIKAISSFDFL